MTRSGRFELSAEDRAALERHHEAQRPTLFADNFPWNDPDFTRRFTVLTDVRRSYWGPAALDVHRIEALLEAVGSTRPHVIDLCCGAGRHVMELATRGIRATGIDISPYAIRRARARAATRQTSRKKQVRFIQSDVLSPPDTDEADVVAILCEQIVNFSPAQVAELIARWSRRIVAGGAMIVESPTELPENCDELYWMDEPLFLNGPCWVRHTQTSDPIERSLLEVFTCLREPGANPRSFFNSRKYYTPAEIARAAPGSDVQLLEIPARKPRPDLIWIVLRM